MRISILVALGFAPLCQGAAAAVVDGRPEQPLKEGDPNGGPYAQNRLQNAAILNLRYEAL